MRTGWDKNQCEMVRSLKQHEEFNLLFLKLSKASPLSPPSQPISQPFEFQTSQDGWLSKSQELRTLSQNTVGNPTSKMKNGE